MALLCFSGWLYTESNIHQPFRKWYLCGASQVRYHARYSNTIKTPCIVQMKQGARKEKLIEETFYQGGPSWTEIVIPALSLLTVVGIFPFLASLVRQWWVRYHLTNLRIAVDAGFLGKKHTELSYRDIVAFRSVRRFGGAAGDFVFFLKDGSRLEVRSIPNYDKVYQFLIERKLQPSPTASSSQATKPIN